MVWTPILLHWHLDMPHAAVLAYMLTCHGMVEVRTCTKAVVAPIKAFIVGGRWCGRQRVRATRRSAMPTLQTQRHRGATIPTAATTSYSYSASNSCSLLPGTIYVTACTSATTPTTATVYYNWYLFYHQIYFLAQFVGDFTLSDLVDKPWSQASSPFPPRYMPSF